MIVLLKEKLIEVTKAVAPLVAIALIFQLTFVHAPLGLFLQFLAGSVFAIAGMVLLFVGVDLGILPMGRFIGAELPKKGSLTLILAVAFALGFATTVAEPDVLVLADQVDAISGDDITVGLVIGLTALGLAVLVAIAMARILTGIPMRNLLTVVYGTIIILSLLAPAEFVPLAYDAGSVTTGVLTAPVVIALAVGLSSVLAGRSPLKDGFGLLGFASVGPIITILLMAMVLR